MMKTLGSSKLTNHGRYLWVMILAFCCLWSGPVLAQRYVIDIYNPDVPPKLTVAIPDFQPVNMGNQGPLEVSQGLPARLANNLDITGIFLPLGKEVYLESDTRAGLGREAPLNFKEWTAIAADYVIKGGYALTNTQLVLELRLYDTRSQSMELGKRYTGGHQDGYRMINRFSNEILKLLTGQPGVFGSKIAFVQGMGTAREIFLTEFGGYKVVQVTSGAGPSRMPAVSPTGDIAYVTRVNDQYQLRLNRQVIGQGPLYLSPEFTRDGRLLASISGASDTNIYYFPPGGSPIPITKHWGINISPTVSPDGQYMAFVSDRAGGAQIYIQPLGGGEPRRLTLQGSKNTDPQWSPRGDRIVFVGDEKNIYSIHPDGSDLRQLTAGNGSNTRPTWSPDGRMIAFASTRNGRSQLFVMTANGERQQPIMPDYRGDQRSPYWSPEKVEE